MNAGLANLFSLKSHLIGIALGPADTRFDPVITDIGLGVAARIENFCDRKLSRVVGDMHVCMADRATISLPRNPIEEITRIGIKFDEADGWEYGTDNVPVIQTLSQQSGIVYLTAADGSGAGGTYFNTDAGPFYAQLQFTYTGGYFFETLEPDEPGYPSAVPAGATVLPDDLRLAWLTQCRRVWSAFDKLGAKILDDSRAANAALAALDWPPEGKKILEHYRRLQLV
ncbi:MAG: hypothetical protein KGJ88_04025 [Verrucomicrobiota bacterium]|nr:hypothetical protein [Verrucomicrobiota bacterium]